MLSSAVKLMCRYATVVTAVHTVDPVVLIYIRVDVDEPSVLIYREPFVAVIVGAPAPAYIVIPLTDMLVNEGFNPFDTAIIIIS